jgi:hypothetical protein
MAEKLQTQEENQAVYQKLSHLELVKFSIVGILLLPNSIREIRHMSHAHHTMPTVEHIPKPHSEESQFHLTLILILILKLLTAIEFQTSQNKLLNQSQLLCNQEDVCTYIQLPPKERAPHLFLLVRTKRESANQHSTNGQQYHATLKSG